MGINIANFANVEEIDSKMIVFKGLKRFLAVLSVIVTMLVVSGSDDSVPQLAYARSWASTAVREMYRSGVPASITLAQGILESRSGQSALSTEGNNHFGIKCHSDWKGRSMRVDDDRKNECFRVYDSADESFRDHSDFLRYSDRYKMLFEFEVTDYESWAHGLKKAGYATDPAYASKLIKIIEDYGLAEYDTMSQRDADRISSEYAKQESKQVKESRTPVKEEKETVVQPKAEEKPAKAQKEKKARKSKKNKDKEEVLPAVQQDDVQPVEETKRVGKKRNASGKVIVNPDHVEDVIPDSPLRMEAARMVTREASEEFHFSLSRPVYTMNGVPFVYSVEGESYSSIAASFNLFAKEILKINDLVEEQRLDPGTIVYVQQKKNLAQKGLDKYIVESDGESLRDICQRFGVKMSSVNRMNDFKDGHQLRSGDTVILRK